MLKSIDQLRNAVRVGAGQRPHWVQASRRTGLVKETGDRALYGTAIRRRIVCCLFATVATLMTWNSRSGSRRYAV